MAQFIAAISMLGLAESDAEYADSAALMLRRAADQGLAIAQTMVGALYYEGFGTFKQDFAEAARWYQRAAGQGLVVAQLGLAGMYAHGTGVPKDAVKSVLWYRRAAERGEVRAQILIAGYYHKGEGVPKEVVKAYAWLAVAAALDPDADMGGEPVAAARDGYAAQILTSGQISEGTRLAQELWDRLGSSRHTLMIQTPFPSADARELRARVLAILGVEAAMPHERQEFKTWEHQLARVYRRPITLQGVHSVSVTGQAAIRSFS
ncbi:MAG: tetratricopeptide repeat protein [Spirochaetaceae bacterium]|nr:tetratricopeptide repeat protein [Spirochaetaceae bacterium]